MTKNGSVAIANLRLGDEVMTLDEHASPKWTTVERTYTIRGNFSYVTIDFSSQPLGLNASHPMPNQLTVSANHPMLVQENLHMVVREASALTPGVKVPTSTGLVAVTGVAPVRRNTKISVATEDCTILANGIHTTTNCENPKRSAMLLALAEDPSKTYADEVSSWGVAAEAISAAFEQRNIEV